MTYSQISTNFLNIGKSVLKIVAEPSARQKNKLNPITQDTGINYIKTDNLIRH